jgi:hypothetical protein
VPSSNGSVTYPPTGIGLAQLGGVLPELRGILRTKEAKKHKGIINKKYYYTTYYYMDCCSSGHFLLPPSHFDCCGG